MSTESEDVLPPPEYDIVSTEQDPSNMDSYLSLAVDIPGCIALTESLSLAVALS